MATRITGDNVNVPGYVNLENPLIEREKALVTDADGNIVSSEASVADLELLGSVIRIRSSMLQIKCPDNNLFYDVTIRLVMGVPTLSVEGAGEV